MKYHKIAPPIISSNYMYLLSRDRVIHLGASGFIKEFFQAQRFGRNLHLMHRCVLIRNHDQVNIVFTMCWKATHIGEAVAPAPSQVRCSQVGSMMSLKAVQQTATCTDATLQGAGICTG